MVGRDAECLAQELLTWPAAERARLAELLIASLEPSEIDSEAAWAVEIDRRAADLDGGRVRGVAVAEVLAEIDRRLGP